MNSPANITTTIPNNSLLSQLQQIGLRAIPAAGPDDFLARATKVPAGRSNLISERNRFAVLCRGRQSPAAWRPYGGRTFCGEAVARGSVNHTPRVGVTGGAGNRAIIASGRLHVR
jgi:hypothetical protein